MNVQQIVLNNYLTDVSNTYPKPSVMKWFLNKLDEESPTYIEKKEFLGLTQNAIFAKFPFAKKYIYQSWNYTSHEIQFENSSLSLRFDEKGVCIQSIIFENFENAGEIDIAKNLKSLLLRE